MPSEACEPYRDEEGRLLHRPLAEHVVKRIEGQPAIVTGYNDKRDSEPAPLPFSLSALQIEAAKRFGFSAQNVLDICQKLYETHKLITYPRSDSRYLPEEHFAGRHAVLNAIAVHAADLLPQPVVDPEIRNRCWDDKRSTRTMRLSQPPAAAVKLTDNEAKVYTLIARQYLMQFCPDAVFRKCQIDLEIANGKFVAKARFLAEAGWRTLLGSKERDEENDGTPLPVVAKGDELLCERGEVVERQTQPPRHFTDATLLSAMTGIARFVQDKDLKKILRATDGLGTEATRAGIIELLFKRGFLSKRGAISTLRRPAGRSFIPAGDGRATGHDRPLGVGVDADQRETVPLSGLYAAAGGDAVSTDRSGAQHAGASVPRPGGAGRGEEVVQQR